MTPITLVQQGPFAIASLMIAAFAIGVISGALHSLLLWRSVRTFVCHGSWCHAASARTLRLILVTAMLAVISRAGVLPLFLALLAFLVVRTAVIRHVALAL